MLVIAGSPTPSQFRAARAVLGWSLIEASRRAGLSIATISRSEHVEDFVRSANARTVVKACYEKAGVNFVQIEEGRGLVWEIPDDQARL